MEISTQTAPPVPLARTCSASPVVLTVTLNTCKDCLHLDHSGAFTPGGAKQICGAAGKRNAPAGDPEPWHWKHRVIEDLSTTPPPWCPLRQNDQVDLTGGRRGPNLEKDVPAG